MLPIDAEKLRRCVRCAREGPEVEFTKGGKGVHCKQCWALQSREWRDKHPGHGERFKEYKRANPDKVKRWTKTYSENNREMLAAKNHSWYEKNREYAKRKAQEWRAANPEKVRVGLKDQRGRRLSAEGKFTVGDVRRLYEEQNGRCPACDADLSRGYHVDHVMPLSRGGTNWPDNLQLLCCPCNQAKGSKLPYQWGEIVKLRRSAAMADRCQ